MRKPTVRSLSSSSRASTSSIKRKRVGVEVVRERRALADRARLDLEDVGEPVTDQLEHRLPIERRSFYVGLGGHALLRLPGAASRESGTAAVTGF